MTGLEKKVAGSKCFQFLKKNYSQKGRENVRIVKREQRREQGGGGLWKIYPSEIIVLVNYGNYYNKSFLFSFLSRVITHSLKVKIILPDYLVLIFIL